MSEELTPELILAITQYVDIEAPPDAPTAHVVFGTNQPRPAAIAAERYHRGLAPVIILTGGVNRHDGTVEAREFHRVLAALDVLDSAIRIEDGSATTQQNVELSRPFLLAALADGLEITAVAKWFHRRAIQYLRTLVPEAVSFCAVSWEPVHGDALVTRDSWHRTPEGRRRVIREWEEVRSRIADGTFRDAERVDGAWR